jgi:hypothetical protein
MKTFQVNLVLLMSLCVLLDIVEQSNGTTLPIPAEMDGENLGKSNVPPDNDIKNTQLINRSVLAGNTWIWFAS